jgi:hypothetical protein
MRTLMEGVRDCHAQHREVRGRVAAVELARRGLKAGDRTWLKDDVASEKRSEATGLAYSAARPHAVARTGYLSQLDEILPRSEQIRAGDPPALDVLLDFLEIRVPAFNCGYWKEAYYKQLRGVPLSEDQTERLRSLFLELCASPKHERELGAFKKLMIQLADRRVVARLDELAGDGTKPLMALRAARLRSVLLHHRADLRT